MAEQSRYEQFDQALEALLLGSKAAPRPAPELAPLLDLAAELRDLPRPSFKSRLKTELEKEASMPTTTTAVQPIRPGFHTITPYIMVHDAAGLIDFVKQSFGAQELYRGTGGAGGIHCEVRLGDSMLMLGGGGAWRGTPRPTSIHLYVDDPDAAYQRALAAGASSLYEPADKPYGDREGGVVDRFGNRWYIGQYRRGGPKPAELHTVTAGLQIQGTATLIGFLQRALGAEVVERVESPDGAIKYAELRIGDSILELGEAHGPFQPLPTSIYLSVEDCDALYARAVAAGAVSLYPPADQPYGDRNAGIQDPAGNQWYISTHIRDVAP